MAHQSQISDYSTNTISQTLLEEISHAIQHVSPYGSVEIYVQDSLVTQITVRNIKKTTHSPLKKQTNIAIASQNTSSIK